LSVVADWYAKRSAFLGSLRIGRKGDVIIPADGTFDIGVE
jgi:hypothetical protein